jgi:hypothetical protein
VLIDADAGPARAELTPASSGSVSRDAPPTTLYELLLPHRVHFPDLLERHAAYATIFRLIRSLISVAPNCAPIMEIWPPALKSYNVLVPAFLNLPFILWGVAAPRRLLGLGMYYSSRGQGCMYCSMHSCVFSLRRGTPAASLQGMHLSQQESVVARTAYALGSIPCRIAEADRAAMRAAFSASDEEWLILGCCMMGWLNRWMDLVGVDLEETALEATGTTLLDDPAGWSAEGHVVAPPQDKLQTPSKRSNIRRDTLASNAALFKYFPTVIKYDAEATKGVPKTWPAVGDFLRARTGHSFPVLGRLRHSRVICAIATIVSENLSAVTSSLDLDLKYFAVMTFAGCVGNRLLFEEFRKIALGNCPELPTATLDAVTRFAWDDRPETNDFSSIDLDAMALGAAPDLSYGDRMLLVFAKAGSSNPPKTPPLIVEIADTMMTPSQVVEMVTLLATANLLHRLYAYYLPGSFDGALAPYEDEGDEL